MSSALSNLKGYSLVYIMIATSVCLHDPMCQLSVRRPKQVDDGADSQRYTLHQNTVTNGIVGKQVHLDLIRVAAQQTLIGQTAVQQSWQLSPSVTASQYDKGSAMVDAAHARQHLASLSV